MKYTDTLSNFLQNKNVQDLCLWLSISVFIYITIPILTCYLFIPYYPELSYVILGLIGVVMSMLVPIIHFSMRYGFVSFSDFSLRGKNLLILFLSLLALFIFISLGIIGGGWRNETIISLKSAGGLQLVVGTIVIMTIGPVLEEMLWRKYVLTILRQSLSGFAAVFITVCMETLFHLGFFRQGLVSIALIFFPLMFFTIVYLKSSLGVSIATHCVMNIFTLALSK